MRAFRGILSQLSSVCLSLILVVVALSPIRFLWWYALSIYRCSTTSLLLVIDIIVWACFRRSPLIYRVGVLNSKIPRHLCHQGLVLRDCHHLCPCLLIIIPTEASSLRVQAIWTETTPRRLMLEKGPHLHETACLLLKWLLHRVETTCPMKLKGSTTSWNLPLESLRPRDLPLMHSRHLFL